MEAAPERAAARKPTRAEQPETARIRERIAEEETRETVVKAEVAAPSAPVESPASIEVPNPIIIAAARKPDYRDRLRE
jgi:hypothetical protein